MLIIIISLQIYSMHEAMNYAFLSLYFFAILLYSVAIVLDYALLFSVDAEKQGISFSWMTSFTVVAGVLLRLHSL